MIAREIKPWDKFSVGVNTVGLSDDALTEIKEWLSPLAGSREIDRKPSERKLPLVTKEIARAKSSFLDSGPGFFILDGLQKLAYQERDLAETFQTLSLMIGEAMPQTSEGDFVVEVRDLGVTLGQGARYHHTREGGGMHTDSPQWNYVPDYLGLLCISKGFRGGACRLASGLQLYQELLRLYPEDVELLQQPFYFDKRGDLAEGEEPTTFEPIISFRKNQIAIRYLRKYIDDGHQLVGIPLTPSQVRALDHLDGLLDNDRLILEFELEAGQCYFANNHVILHGRREFFDTDFMKRLCLRMWLQNRSPARRRD